MDWMPVLMIAGVVFAGIAALFSFLEWKARRAKPNLVLLIGRVNSSMVGVKRSVSFQLILRNEGRAPAIGWRVSGITTTYRWEAFDVEAGAFGTSGTRDHSTITWRGALADETIEPGQQVGIGLGMGMFNPDEVPRLDMTIQARDMKPIHTKVRVLWPEGRYEPQVDVG